MKRLLNIFLMALVWLLIAALILLVVGRVRSSRETLTIRSLTINIKGDINSPRASIVQSDEGKEAKLGEANEDVRTNITEKNIRTILSNSKVELVGKSVNAVSLRYVEGLLTDSGYIERAECYIDANGDMTIDVWRRSASIRLMLDGYNSYLTEDGFLFEAPRGSPILTHLATGSYRPIFPKGYNGYLEDYVEGKIEDIDREIEQIEHEKYPILKRQKENREDFGELRKRFISRKLWESEDEFDERVVKVREENQSMRRQLSDRAARIDRDMAAVERRIDNERIAQKKLRKKCEDIYNLLIFVNSINSDSFWRSEIVQIILTEGSSSDMRIELLVRSGDFKIVFGSLSTLNDFCWGDKEVDWSEIYDEERVWNEIYGVGERGVMPFMSNIRRIRARSVERLRASRQEAVEEIIDERLERLEGFYDRALGRMGWDRYREINVEFKNQIVAR